MNVCRIRTEPSGSQRCRGEAVARRPLRLERTQRRGACSDYPPREGFEITPIVAWCDAAIELTPNPQEKLRQQMSLASLVSIPSLGVA